jgi:hypothetical protein
MVTMMLLQLMDQSDLRAAHRHASWLRRPAVQQVEIGEGLLDGTERVQTAAALRRWFNDCGCGVGTIALLTTMAALLLTFGWTLPSLAVALASGLIAALAGKLAGLAWSRHRIHHTLRRIADAAPTPASGLGPGRPEFPASQTLRLRQP